MTGEGKTGEIKFGSSERLREADLGLKGGKKKNGGRKSERSEENILEEDVTGKVDSKRYKAERRPKPATLKEVEAAGMVKDTQIKERIEKKAEPKAEQILKEKLNDNKEIKEESVEGIINDTINNLKNMAKTPETGYDNAPEEDEIKVQDKKAEVKAPAKEKAEYPFKTAAEVKRAGELGIKDNNKISAAKFREMIAEKENQLKQEAVEPKIEAKNDEGKREAAEKKLVSEAVDFYKNMPKDLLRVANERRDILSPSAQEALDRVLKENPLSEKEEAKISPENIEKQENSEKEERLAADEEVKEAFKESGESVLEGAQPPGYMGRMPEKEGSVRAKWEAAKEDINKRWEDYVSEHAGPGNMTKKKMAYLTQDFLLKELGLFQKWGFARNNMELQDANGEAVYKLKRSFWNRTFEFYKMDGSKDKKGKFIGEVAARFGPRRIKIPEKHSPEYKRLSSDYLSRIGIEGKGSLIERLQNELKDNIIADIRSEGKKGTAENK